MVMWPPAPVLELAQRAVDSRGDPGTTIHRALDPAMQPIQWFLDLKPQLCGGTSPEACHDLFRQSLFIVDEFGGNDYNSPLFVFCPLSEAHAFVPHVVESIGHSVERLIAVGARELVVPGYSPSAASPSTSPSFGSRRRGRCGRQTTAARGKRKEGRGKREEKARRRTEEEEARVQVQVAAAALGTYAGLFLVFRVLDFFLVLHEFFPVLWLLLVFHFVTRRFLQKHRGGVRQQKRRAIKGRLQRRAPRGSEQKLLRTEMLGAPGQESDGGR